MDSLVLKDLVLIGGGHSHVHILKMFGMQPMTGVRLTLISRDIESPYSGMIPGFVAGYYARHECHLDHSKLCAFSRARLVIAEVTALDTTNRLILCNDGRPPIKYDILSINIGVIPRPLSEKSSSTDRIIPVKPIDRFAERWETLFHKIEIGKEESITIAVVGGGAGGLELAFAVRARLQKLVESRERAVPLRQRVILISKGSDILASHSLMARNIVRRILQEKGIELIVNKEIIRSIWNGKQLDLVSSDGTVAQCDECFWCTQVWHHIYSKNS